MRLDYEDRLLDFIDTLEVGFPVYADSNTENSSISVVRMPGGRTLLEHYDGTKEKQYNLFVQIKAKQEERQLAVDAVQIIADALDEALDIPSENNSYEYGQTTVSNEPYFMGSDTNGGYYFRFSFQSELTIFN